MSVSSGYDWQYYRYNPSLAAAVIFIVLFGLRMVEAAPSCRYLGVNFDPKLQWKKHMENIGRRIYKSIHALASLAGTELRRIYQAVVVPQMLYGCTAWSVAQNRGEGYTRSGIDYLRSLRAKAARVIGGAYRSSSGAAMDVELYLLPVEHQIWKANVEVLGRRLSTEKNGHHWNKLIIFATNQAAIRTFQDSKGKSGAYIVAETVALIDKLHKNLHTCGNALGSSAYGHPRERGSRYRRPLGGGGCWLHSCVMKCRADYHT